MNRRNFTKNCGKLCFSAMLGGAFLQSCQVIQRVPNVLKGNQLIVNKSDCGDAKIVIIETEKLPSSIYLNMSDEENYIALFMQCTHLQCDVIPSGNILHCPCHGSEFSSTGKVLESPATEDLQQFKVTSDREKIYISL